MAGRLSFQIAMEGGAETLAQMREIIAAQKQLKMGIGGGGTGGGSSGGNVVHGLKEPQYGRALARIHAMGDINDQGKKSSFFSKFMDLGPTVGKIAAGFTLGTLAVKAFNAALEGATGAVHKAFGLYTGAAQQGLSTEFYTRRQALSGILGVQGNPNNVFYFGKAIQELDKRIAGATHTISTNARPLAEMEMNAKILKLDLDAVASKIAVKLVPAMNAWINAIDILSKIQPPQWLKNLTRAGYAISTLGGSELALGLNRWIEKKFGTVGVGGIGQLATMAKQLPASQWEHMGLVIGGGMQNKALEYQRQTAQAVTKLVAISQKGVGKNNGYFLGYNPNVNAH